ncbi:hypothetical protein ACFOEX_13255, partial [Camelimonas abortus]
DAAGLSRAVTALAPLAAWSPQRDASPAAPPPAPEQEAALAGLLIAHAALARAESRGAHFRRDCPGRAPASRRQFLDPATALAPYAAPPRAAAHPA